jgi:hypothetical protein
MDHRVKPGGDDSFAMAGLVPAILIMIDLFCGPPGAAHSDDHFSDADRGDARQHGRPVGAAGGSFQHLVGDSESVRIRWFAGGISCVQTVVHGRLPFSLVA